MPEWKHHQRLSACREQMSLHRFSLCGLGTLASSHSSVLIGKSRAGCKGQSKLQALYRFYIPRVWDSSQKVRENTKYFEWTKRQKTRTITRTISQEICKFYSTFFFCFYDSSFGNSIHVYDALWSHSPLLTLSSLFPTPANSFVLSNLF